MPNSAFGHEPTITVPGSSTDNAVVRFNQTTGASFQNSGVLIDDSNNIVIPGTLTLGSQALTAANLTDLVDGGATALHSHSGSGISFSGSTANGMVTYGSSSSAIVEPKLTYDGDGALVMTNSSGSNNWINHATATSGTANPSRLILRTAENNAADTYISFHGVETYEYSVGVDNSDGDKFKISGSALGTNDKLTIASTGYGGQPLVSVGSATNNRFGFWTKNTQSVGTSLTYIINQSDNVTSGQGGLVFVCGRESSGSTKKFYDLLIHTYKDGGTVVTVGSGAENGASSRTYDENQGGLRLRMSSGTYDVAVWVLSAPNVE